ncbi:MAG: hypothetical protein PVH87_03425 [Desulfobacteraceae bacterium]|jgi:hypothetical protein
MGKIPKLNLISILIIAISLLSFQSVLAVPVTVSDVPGYGYNSAAYQDGGRYVGCGPTSAVMILDTYDNRLSGADGAPGDLVADPLSTAWDLHFNYMNTDAGGFGSPSDFHYGIEDYALDQGFILDAVIHVESTTYNPADWGYSYGDDLIADADFWDTNTWDIDDNAFLNFIAAEIDIGAPVVVTVDSDGNGSDDHWMVAVGYDMEAGQWAGYNTWDSSLHWYDVESAFLAGNTMGIAFVRTFDFLGPVDGDDDVTPTPEPNTIFLLVTGIVCLAGFGRHKLIK